MNEQATATTPPQVNYSAAHGVGQGFWAGITDTGGSFDIGTPEPKQSDTTSPIDKALSRLSGVRRTGESQWLAQCPAHDDGRPSLSIKETDGGTLLLHCFALCQPVEVVEALGLRMGDLFVDRSHKRPCGRHERRIPPQDRLQAIDYEALIVATIANDICQRGSVDADTMQRLSTACGRIGNARGAV